MSTKLYDGYLIHLPPAKVFDSDSRWFKSLADKVYANAKVQSARICAEAICSKWDTGDTEYTLSHAISDLWDRQRRIEKEGTRDFEVDFDLSLLFYPTKHRKDSVLAYAIVDNIDVRKILEAHPHVEPYPYWDNTDPDEGISYKDWRKRGREWVRAIGRVTFGTRGFERKCMSTYGKPMPTMELVVEHQPTVAERALDLARNKAFNAVMPRYLQEDRRNVVSAIFDAQDDPDHRGYGVEGTRRHHRATHGRSDAQSVD